jgi:hypothetical protein
MAVGPPAAGKTAVLARLASEHDFIRIDVSQLLREEAKRDTELGSLIRRSTVAHGGNVFAALPEVRVRTLVVTMNGYLDAGKRSFLIENFPQSTEDIVVWRKALKVNADGGALTLPGLGSDAAAGDGNGDERSKDAAASAASSPTADQGGNGGGGGGGDGEKFRHAFEPLVINFVCPDVAQRRERLRVRGRPWDTDINFAARETVFHQLVAPAIQQMRSAVGGASALGTFICVLCALCTQISRPICNTLQITVINVDSSFGAESVYNVGSECSCHQTFICVFCTACNITINTQLCLYSACGTCLCSSPTVTTTRIFRIKQLSKFPTRKTPLHIN